MKAQFAALATAVSAICLVAASHLYAKTIHLSAALSGASEVPANTTSGTGSVAADFNTATNAFSYTAAYSGLTGPAVAAHFHGPAVAGANAPPIIMIKELASPIKGTTALSPNQAKDLLTGKWYFNVHTAAHPSGEVRGQLIASRPTNRVRRRIRR
ncbi:MAG: CHRD domain-containing protein [Sphingobium sp.]